MIRRTLPELPQSPSEISLALNASKDLKVPECPKKSTERLSLITQEEMQIIRDVIRDIAVPSGFTRLTPSFGTKSHGKLKADEWRSLFTVYLPISLLLAWHNRQDRMKHLKALLFLIILVHIAVSRTSSQAGSILYRDAILLYLNLIRALYPQHQFTVNHHLAMHLPLFMDLHGPCRSHWAFPFERLIGRLQKTRLNNQLGKIRS